jgi:hypothetical protein
MRAILVAALYFGSFLAIGLIARLAARKWIDRGGTSLADVHSLAGSHRRKHRAFLLGAWRDED